MPAKRQLLVASAWVFLMAALVCEHSIRALHSRAERLRAQIAELNGRLENARHTMATTQALEEEADASRGEVQRLEHASPAGSPLAWLPGRIKEHFRRFGFTEITTRLNTREVEPELPAYGRLYWAVGLPLGEKPKDLRNLLLAVAELHETERLAQVIDLAIQPDPFNAHGRTAVVTVAVLARN